MAKRLPKPKSEAEIKRQVEKMVRKKKEELIYNCNVNLLFHNKSFQQVLNSFNEIQNSNPEANIRVKIRNSSWYNSNTISFVNYRDETTEEFEKRKAALLKRKIAVFKREEKARLKKEEKEREFKKLQLKQLVEDFGPEIYQIFEEIKSNS